MIKQFFPSKKPVVVANAFNSYRPPHEKYTLTEEQRAAKRGLSTEVYRHRVGIVARAQASLGLFVTDQGFPINVEDREKHGACIVVGICRHYDDYGDVEWHEPPYILSVSPIKNRQLTINCTGNWLVKGKTISNVSTEVEC